jgi:signal transduction histidine kinase
VFLIAGLWLAHRILKPLRLLQEGVHKIGEGQLSHRLTIRTGDEIQKVAEEFNAMADSLEHLEETKRDLTHMIVHDLKSPLSSVLGSLDYVLMASKEISVEHKKLLMLGSKAGKDQLRMIQNLLDMGKMEEGKLELKRETFPLLDLAAKCVDDLEANMYREGKMVSVEVPKDLPKVWADRDLMHRVLSNLLSNALKHTAKGAEIAIRGGVSDDKKSLMVSVKDTGEGIPSEFLDKVFEKFGQADLRKQNFRVGSGLGLTFCKLAVESHGGRIWVESRLGQGSEFFVQIPLPAEDHTKDPVAFPSTKISR